jgi:AcrR family transcriptional regulator
VFCGRRSRRLTATGPLTRVTSTVAVTAQTNAERIARRQANKFAERRDELAAAALVTLGELGYARTSLREIAQNSEFSHGVLHYYFADKVELITHCVRLYKKECVTRYDAVVERSTTAAELADGFADAMVTTMREEAAMHRLWYDLRAQSMFEESFRSDVAAIDLSLEQMIWRVVSRYAELAGIEPALSPQLTYALFDGLFQQSLLMHLYGNDAAEQTLRDGIAAILVRLRT